MTIERPLEPKVLAIITARGGSKGLPNKNIMELGGIPLVAHTIKAALESEVFTKVVVTSDCPKILKLSESFGSSKILRPAALAGDKSSSLDAICHVINELKEKGEVFDYFALLQPTSPFRSAVHIKEAYNLFLDKRCSSLVSAVEEEHSSFKSLVKKGDNLEPIVSWEMLTMPRQALPKSYRVNGAIYFSISKLFERSNSLFVKPIGLYEMSLADSLDIDSFEDFKQAQARVINESSICN